ncbi:MAG: hypothetical protein Q7W56_06655 [Candidatus Latescibacteria bacterium]|nr:hypothetical protein [Candidatus Latescibacterota bacterium]
MIANLRKRLGGWARLGVVISVIWGVVVGVNSYDERPTLDELKWEWFYDAAIVLSKDAKANGLDVEPFAMRQHLYKKYGKELWEWLESVGDSPTESQQAYSAAIAKVNSKHKQIIAGLRMKQLKFWSQVIAIWVGGVCCLFGVGWTVGWVYRGFRPKVNRKDI